MAREGLGLGTSIRNYQAIFLYLLAGQGNTALSFESAEVLEDGQYSLISREGLRWYCKDSEDFDGNLFFLFLTKKNPTLSQTIVPDKLLGVHFLIPLTLDEISGKRLLLLVFCSGLPRCYPQDPG